MFFKISIFSLLTFLVASQFTMPADYTIPGVTMPKEEDLQAMVESAMEEGGEEGEDYSDFAFEEMAPLKPLHPDHPAHPDHPGHGGNFQVGEPNTVGVEMPPIK